MRTPDSRPLKQLPLRRFRHRAQQDLDLGNALSVDAWTLACLRAPMLADALRVIWQILPSELVAAQFAADRAGRALQHTGDGRIDMPVSYNACKRYRSGRSRRLDDMGNSTWW